MAKQVLSALLHHSTYFGLGRSLLIFLWISLLHSPDPALGQEQPECSPPENRKAARIFEKALALPTYQASETRKYLLEVVGLVPEHAEAWYLLGNLYLEEAQKGMQGPDRRQESLRTKAIKAFERSYTLCPAFDRYRAAFFLGKEAYEGKDFKKALPLLQKFLAGQSGAANAEAKEAAGMVRRMEVYFDLLAHPVPFNPKKVSNICSQGDEYLPLISPDGDFFFYTRRYMGEDKYTTFQREFEDFRISEKLKPTPGFDELFSQGERMPSPFNTGANQGGVSISIDNQQMFITRCDFVQVNDEPYNNCDIYFTRLVDGQWEPLKALPPAINGRNTWEGQPSVTADGRTLFFASARPGTLGGTDIYYSRRDASGQWGKPVNLGPSINTEGNDKSPFIHSDSRTLYFSSDGYPGVGGFDIYYARQVGDTAWTTPVNIGYPINNEADDLGFVVSTDGKRAYFSSNTLQDASGWDIYSFELYQEARPEQVLFVKGQLSDMEGNDLENASVQLKSVTRSQVTEGLVDKLTGRYAVAVSVEPREEFLLTVRKTNYAFSSQYIRTETDTILRKPVILDFEVKPLEVGVEVKLNNILFATSSAEFDNASRVVLSSFSEFLKENPTVKISILGHTDNMGTPAANIDLSNRRAKAVFDYLVSQGIEAGRLAWKGYGQTRPVADNLTDEGRALNRRTEFLIVEK